MSEGTPCRAAGSSRLRCSCDRSSRNLSHLPRTVVSVRTFRDVTVVLLVILDVAAVVWGVYGGWHVIRVLHKAPPAEAREPRTRLEQLRVAYAGRFRGWVVVFSAALVGAAVSDYDRDPRRGLGRMVALFLFVTAGLIVMAGVSIGRAGKRAVEEADMKVRGYDKHDLLLSCIVGSIALAFGILAGAA